MLIVLEGCDATGKTTIAELIRMVMPDSEVVHCTASTPNDFDFFNHLITIGQYHNLILDRGMYGQFVYQNWDERKLSKDQLTQLELRMLETGAKLIYVSASEDKIEERLKERGETSEIPVKTLLEYFDDVLEVSILPVYRIDTTNNLSIWRE